MTDQVASGGTGRGGPGPGRAAAAAAAPGRTVRGLARCLLGAALGALLTVLPAAGASADAGSVWTVVNTGGVGVLSRDAAALGSVTGYGPAEGEQVVDICQVLDGDPVGSYANRIWHLVSTPRHGATWVPDTYLDTPNIANEPTPGTPLCGAAAPSDGGTGWAPDCEPASPYIDGVISVSVTAEGRKISLTPTARAREAYPLGDGRTATVEMWHAIQGCVTGLEGAKADSIWQQLECHVLGGRFASATGPTFDLETWRPALAGPNPLSYVQKKCLNGDVSPTAGIDVSDYLA